MSIVYADADVSILNDSVSPTFTLMSVANPWIDGSPDPEMSHTDSGVPGLEFSHAITLTGGVQGSAAEADPEDSGTRAATRVRTTSAAHPDLRVPSLCVMSSPTWAAAYQATGACPSAVATTVGPLSVPPGGLRPHG